MLLYYISDRRQFPGSPAGQKAALLRKISEAAGVGVDYIQLREKDLGARELLELAGQAVAAVRNARSKLPESGDRKPRTRLLINSRLDVALACGADGVHLRSDDISAAEARVVWSRAGDSGADRLCVAVSCHTPEEVWRAESDGADFVVFAPVFEKSGQAGVGLVALRAACGRAAQANTPEPSRALRIPVLALGGVTVGNALSCVQAGAAGIAGIRLFQENDIAEVVRRLRAVAGAGVLP